MLLLSSRTEFRSATLSAPVDYAAAVLIGRAYLWGLGANGQAGVENVLDLLRSGVNACLLGLGHSSIPELSPDDLVIPPGFTRRLGG